MRQIVIFSCAVNSLLSCGIYFLLPQTQSEPCLSTLQIYSAAGLDEVEARARNGGKSFHIASGGLCGEREIADVLKISPIPFIELNGIVSYLYSFGVNKEIWRN
ncbi:hypothetical protein MTR67_004261 [Solanum verrucosum]|uniref:Lipoprotein n=1 Tax=Solanum verrucosum TaxID=315347 RepID=A0AAF0PUB9_SOLVR|nr:hypothetical protein MTR67_004261 [Solanum verrucosum]